MTPLCRPVGKVSSIFVRSYDWARENERLPGMFTGKFSKERLLLILRKVI